MKNDIIRKLTSLTLMSIMVAGGLTFAIPSALPQAVAAPETDGDLTVSSTEFGGQQVIEIKVDDSDTRSTTDPFTLSVTIDGNDVHMIQATTGVWYAYVADDGAAADNPLIDDNADRLSSAPETSSTVVRGLTLAHAPNANANTDASNPANIAGNWPYVQLYDFTSGNDLDVVYRSDKVTVTYDDDLTGSASISLDRNEMAEGNIVHVTISDTRLNMDPTGEDTWRLYTDGAAALLTGDDDTADTDYTNVTLGDDGHGDLDLPGVLATEPSNYVAVTEDDRNSGAFGSVLDDDDNSSITLSGAQENARHTASYAGNDDGFIVRDFSTGIGITTADDFWNSGEAATVTLDAKNLDTNTKSSQDITVEESEVVPTLIFGEPITIENFTPYDYGWLASTDGHSVDVDTDGTLGGGENRMNVRGLSTTTVVINSTGVDPVEITNGTSVNGGMITLPDSDVIESRIYKLDAIIPLEAATDGTILFEIEGAAVSAPFYYVHISTNTGVTLELVNSTDPTDAVTPNTVVTAADNPLPADLQIRVAVDGAATVDIPNGSIIILDILSFGETDDGVENNAIYRHELEETDAGGSFEGTIEYIMLNQINIADSATYNIDTDDDELTIIIDDEYTGSDAPQISYAGETARVGVMTSGGTVSFDSDSYSTFGTVTVTLVDQDLNVDDSEAESYTIENDGSVRGADSAKPLLEFEISGIAWDDRCEKDLGLPPAFTLEESADSPGTFTAEFDIPSSYCDESDDSDNPERNDKLGTGTVTGKSIQVLYYDFRDDTGIESTWSDSATIQASSGTVSLDRNVYPVPSALIVDSDNNELRGEKAVTVHIEISDPDHNSDSAVLNKIDSSAVNVAITPVSASSPTSITNERTDADDNARPSLLDNANRDNREINTLATEFEETSEDSGIFTETIEIPYDILGYTANNDLRDPISQSYILSVTYSDESDATGASAEVTDSAIFNIGTASIGTDATEYALKQKAFIELVDHDSNYDSDSRETVSLKYIEWEGSADTTLDHEDNPDFDPSTPFLRETEANSGIFLVEITIPEKVKDRGEFSEDVGLGESITLTYTDYSPAGADYPGLDDRSVETGFTISRVGASLTLDKDIYSWRDRITITVVAPDFNIDALAVESIDRDLVNIRSQLGSDTVLLAETGSNTGIFQGTVDLGGFAYSVAKGVMAQPAGMLEVGNEDGISVTFTYDEDERDLVQSALIRWNVAEVTWLEESYREGATGILRVVDIDRNLHPDTPDSIETIVFSDTYRGGIRVALTETEPNSGVFEGEVIFDVLHSEGNRLQVSEGDIVTAAYDDRTLPPPDGEDDSLRITGTTTVGSIVPPLERVAVSNLGVVDALGSAVDSVSVGQQVNIAADLASAQSRSQDYAYLLQIQNMDGVTVHLSWAASSLAGFGGANVSQSWTPDEAGSYTATVFVWESLTNPTALSPQNSIDITVV